MAGQFEDDFGVVTDERQEVKTKRPPLYRVLLHNDDYTTREFVVHILQRIFRKNEGEATRIMMHVHSHGIGVAGLYTREIAETKISTVEDMANEEEFPFQLTMEPAAEDHS